MPKLKNWKNAIVNRELEGGGVPDGGEEEIRTPDPHVANVMLYQLSYFPIG